MTFRSVSKRRVGRTCDRHSEIAGLRKQVRDLKRECDGLRSENAKLSAEKAEAERKIEALEAEVARLKTELEASQRQRKRQAAPFSKGAPKSNPRPPGRKPGSKYGKKGHRANPRPEEIDEHYDAPLPDQCPHCHGTSIEETKVENQFQVELPIHPIWRQFDIHIGKCNECGARLQGRHPLQTSDALGAAASQLGAQAQAVIAWLNKRLGLSYGKIVELFGKVFGIPLTRGGSVQVALRMGRKCKNKYDEILESIRQSPWLVSDETGWKVGGRSAWLHVLVGDQGTGYLIARRRSAQVQADKIGNEYAGTMIHDGYSSYNRRFPNATHQQCLQHLMQRVLKMLETARGVARKFPQQILDLCKRALALRDQYRLGQVSRDDLAENYIDLLCRLHAQTRHARPNKDNQTLSKHIRSHLREWFWFLLDPELDATNYRAEQALRFGVTNRKVWGGNRTPAGSEAQAMIMSVIETARRQGKDPLKELQTIIQCEPPP